MPMETTVETPEVRLQFGQSVSRCVREEQILRLDLAVPLLAGEAQEQVCLRDEVTSLDKVGSFHLLRGLCGEVCAGMAIVPCAGLAEAESYQLYRQLLEIVGDQEIYRVWHFIPGINSETDGLEHYRSFNIGRCRAFRESFGSDTLAAHLPAASAVGTEDSHLAVIFTSGRDSVQYFENPNQVPAYQYPEQYGPCSPSFARGAVVSHRDGGRTGFLSGTASIRGHESVARDDVSAQLDVTMENVATMLDRMNFRSALDNHSPVQTQFRIYLRHAEDLPTVQARFESIVGPEIAGTTLFLKADICRADLRLEIEGVFEEPTGSGR